MKTTKIILAFVLTFLLSVNAFADNSDISIIDIDSKNSNILKIFFDKSIETNTDVVTSDIKVFRDLDNKKISKSINNNTVVNLSLESKLEENTTYSLLSVFWVEGTIDFTLWKISDWLEIMGDDSDGILKVVIVDSENIEIHFQNPIESDSVDLKLLREYSLDAMKINQENNKELALYLKNELSDKSKYIVMIFSITTKEWLNYSVSNSIYDFVTDWVSTEKIELPTEELLDWEKTWDIALNSAETPDTWAETWILILSTLLLSNFIYFRKKFKKD